MEYTRGNWKAQRNALGTWTIFTDETHIADVDRHFNAHLIAAAPDMYEALEYVWGWIIKQSSENLKGLELRQIQEALAKAEGGKQ